MRALTYWLKANDRWKQGKRRDVPSGQPRVLALSEVATRLSLLVQV